jgi:hypothetical protein
VYVYVYVYVEIEEGAKSTGVVSIGGSLYV